MQSPPRLVTPEGGTTSLKQTLRYTKTCLGCVYYATIRPEFDQLAEWRLIMLFYCGDEADVEGGWCASRWSIHYMARPYEQKKSQEYLGYDNIFG
ncbi:unnamed protein product [Strongylus vulgaris]|uniref:Uncharacterized protein n=1 Tax=Strongylus vulgaris TaxID=40348 RepID=A0A3P7IZ35_STRVU|nr:unnamed protein product [Strongylus vulgaris]